jgi:D-alanyl-D-alanine carboxypeptidase
MKQDTHNNPDNSTEVFSENITKSPLANPLRIPIREKIPVPQQLLLLGAILLLLLGGSFTPKIIGFFKDNQDTAPAATSYGQNQEQSINTTPDLEIQPFTEVKIKGRSAYVWDVSSQRALYKKDPTKQLPLASLTKLMTTLLAEEILSDNATVAINETSIKQDGDSGLLQSEQFKRKSLSDLVLISSSNDGAYALAAAAGAFLDTNKPAEAFVYAMNVRAKELGLHDTYFRNPTGLDISEKDAGSYGTAKDIAFLMEHIVLQEPDILSATQENQERIYSNDGTYHDAINTNYYISEIPGLIGSKTGYTDLAGGNLVVAFDAGLNRPIIISVLGSSRHERFTDVQALVKEAQRYVAQQ